MLCIHGFTGTPFEMRFLGERLSERGFSVLGPVLPGHGATTAALEQTSWEDWYGCVDAALDRLLVRCDKVAVVGLSLGGLLALRLAQVRGGDLAAVASLAAPLWLGPLARAALGAIRPGSALGRLFPRLPKLGGSDVRDRSAAAQNPAYSMMPVRAAHEVLELMGLVRGDLERVTAPILIMHARRDHTAPYGSSREIAARVGSAVRVHRTLDRSYHLITLDVEREVVADAVGDFFTARLHGSNEDRPPHKEST